MKNLIALLVFGLSLPVMAKLDCSSVASEAARKEFAKLVAPLSVDKGAWVAKTTRSGAVMTYLIEVSADDPSCRECYYAGYYYVKTSAKTCEVLSVKKN